jgi:DNA-3-methyladenine glycosylase II
VTLQPAERAFEVRPRPPFRLDLTVWALRKRAQNAIDTWDGLSYRRAVVVSGLAYEISVTQAGSEDRPRLEIVLRGPQVGPVAEAVVRSALARLLGLDLDLSGFYACAARDSRLDELAERYRGVKPPRFPTIFECLLNTVACQQLSLAAGLTLLSRLAATAGTPAGNLYAFPAPTAVLGLPQAELKTLGFSERKAATILELASAGAAGEFESFEQLDDEAVAEALIRRRGIGPWSADYALLRGLGRLHVFPRGDSGALSGLRRFLIGTKFEDDSDAALAHWAPYAGMVYFHLLLRELEHRGVLDPLVGESGSRGPVRANSQSRERSG